MKNKLFWLVTLTICFTFLVNFALALVVWYQLLPTEATVLSSVLRQYSLYLSCALLLFVGVLGFGLSSLFHAYIAPINSLVEETQLITSVNPSHRIHLEGSSDVRKLAQIINEGADHSDKLRKDVEERISRATFETEEEKAILAAIIAELPVGVLICNTGGQILLYNQRAKQYFNPPNASSKESGRFIGLGRSIFGVIDRNSIAYAMDEISNKLHRNANNIAAYFVMAGMDQNLLRVEAVPILGPDREFTGFVLILYDITKRLEADRRAGQLRQSLTHDIRHSSAGIRSAVEAIQAYPDMDRKQEGHLIDIIHRESVNIGNVIQKEERLSSDLVRTQWPLNRIRTKSLLDIFVKRIEDKIDVDLKVVPEKEYSWVKVCSHSFVLAMMTLLFRLVQESGTRHCRCRIKRKNGFITIEFMWQGNAIRIETLRKWGNQQLVFDKASLPLKLKEIIGHNYAETWSYPDKRDPSQSVMGIFLPAVGVKESATVRNITIMPKSRPLFYDFNLFQQPGQDPELDEQLLTDLTYTVFDTETTGLNPAGGDEIISIGAVRIFNGRLLREDVIDQIIDPRREIPLQSIKFHGIRPEMTRGKPTIDEVLPVFQTFSRDTILVAHNAAFDMRMLQMKEVETGIKIINPVLDTLLLSAVVHPTQTDHNIEAIARRLGVQVMGRHTALGDALVTGEIFLKLIPLLLKNDIRTLKEARDASMQTHYARIKF